MTTDACRRWHGDVAALALGRLDPDREVAVQAHLDGCAACRNELALLRGTVRALDAVGPGELTGDPAEPPRDLEARIADEYARERARDWRRRLRRRGALAAAVSVAAAAVILAAVLAGANHGGPVRPFVRTEEGAEATYALEERSFGTEVRLTVDGLDEGLYWLWLTDASGERTAAGTFRGGTGDRTLTLTAGLDTDDVDRVWVTDEADRVVLDTR